MAADREGLHRVPGAFRQEGGFKSTLKANFTANIVRNVWSSSEIVFCGHFLDQTYTFSQEEVEDETGGHFYCGNCSVPPISKARPCFMFSPGISVTRSSTTFSRTCPVRERVCADRPEGEGHLRALRTALHIGGSHQTAVRLLSNGPSCGSLSGAANQPPSRARTGPPTTTRSCAPSSPSNRTYLPRTWQRR